MRAGRGEDVPCSRKRCRASSGPFARFGSSGSYWQRYPRATQRVHAGLSPEHWYAHRRQHSERHTRKRGRRARTHLRLAVAALGARAHSALELERGRRAIEEALAVRAREHARGVVIVLVAPGDVVRDEVPAVLVLRARRARAAARRRRPGGRRGRERRVRAAARRACAHAAVAEQVLPVACRVEDEVQPCGGGPAGPHGGREVPGHRMG